jgi:hypothetical protein
MVGFIGFVCGIALCVLVYYLMPRTQPLPTDVESLQKLLIAARDKVDNLSSQLRSRDVLIEQLKLQLARLKRLKFGRSSEQLDAQIAQLELSLEELEANAAADPQPAAPTEGPSARPARKPLPAQLPRVPHVHEPTTGKSSCPQCGGSLRTLADDVSEVLEYVPEHWKVHKHIRPKYSCGSCQTIVQASALHDRLSAATQVLVCWLTCWCRNFVIISRCIVRARFMPARESSSTGRLWPNGSARSALWWIRCWVH